MIVLSFLFETYIHESLCVLLSLNAHLKILILLLFSIRLLLPLVKLHSLNNNSPLLIIAFDVLLLNVTPLINTSRASFVIL